MSIKASGRARVETEVADLSVLLNTGLTGIHAVFGRTERGPIDRTVLVGSWAAYRKHFGDLVAGNDFPLICKRALEAGVKLRVGRAVNYTDVTDKGTVTGAAATGALVALGTVFTADNIGIWGNSVTVAVTAAANGVADEFDIVTSIAGDTNQTVIVRNIKGTLTLEEIQKYNASNHLAYLSDAQVGSVLSAASVTLAGGTDTAVIAIADITGDSSQQSGIHIFDNYSDFTRISAPAYAMPEVDAKLASYAVTRMDCRAILRTPTGISGNVAIEYREGTGTYNHDAIDTWLASMVFGGLEISHPVTSQLVTIPALADVMGNYGQKDTKARQWFSAAGPERGQINNALGIDYNLGSPARSLEADSVDVHGINPVIQDATYGLVYWGNSTLQKEKTFLSHENVADLIIYLNRAVAPIAKSELFNPNDVETWRAIHRNVRPLLELVKSQRGIWDYIYQGDHLIDSIEDLDESTVNSPEDVDAGKYQFIVWIKPKVGLKYIGIKFSLTNTGVSFEEVSGQPA